MNATTTATTSPAHGMQIRSTITSGALIQHSESMKIRSSVKGGSALFFD